MYGKCLKCKEHKKLTKHSKGGGHQPPFIWVCRACHDKIHGIIQRPERQFLRTHRKYAKGTTKHHKKK